MGQRLSSTPCCSCLLDCWDPRRSYAAAIKDSTRLSSTASTELNADVQQPLVVEDESWKKWSSYNLIHHKDKVPGTATDDDSLYNPPMYISQTQQQSAEAVWDL